MDGRQSAIAEPEFMAADVKPPPGAPAPPPEKCEQKARWQSKQKHAFLEAYLRIWTGHVGQNPNGGPSLAIVDLHAAHGWCYDKESGKPPWEGTSVLSARYLRDYNTRRGKRLILNTYHPDEATREKQRSDLTEALRAENMRSADAIILSLPVEEAVEFAKKRVNPDFPSLWIIDPYQPEEVPWGVIESIIQHEGKRPGRGKGKETFQTRRPELFINLMTASLQRNVEQNPHLISIVLGLSEDMWRPVFDAYREQTLNKRDAIIEMFLDRLGQFYRKRPRHILVKGAEGNIIYAIIFCTDDDAGYYMMHKEGIPKYQEWLEGKWRPTAEAIAEERRDRRQTERERRELEEARKKHRTLDLFGGEGQ
jgi:three-Cys-motif partner protein